MEVMKTHFSAPYFRIPIGTICRDKYYEFDYYHTSLDNLDFISTKNLVESLKVHFLAINHLEDLNAKDIDNISRKSIQNNKPRIDKSNKFYRSLNPYCEPMLSKRGLYPTLSGSIAQKAFDFKTNHAQRNYNISDKSNDYIGSEIDAIFWLMFYGDGITSLEEISQKSKIRVEFIGEYCKKTRKN